jgi:predicted nucleic acid-binding protein
MDKVFIDTDVIIDFLIDRQPHANHSSKIFDLADRGKVEIYISALSVNNVHYVTRKILGSKKAKTVISELLKFVKTQGVGENDILEALTDDIKDFEDAIQHSSATRIEGIKAIITRNTKDYKNSRLAVFTPETYLKSKTDDL